MDKLTFDKLPEAVAEINHKLDVLLADHTGRAPENSDYLMSLTELRSYLPDAPAAQTVYEWTFKRKIPFEKFGKRVYFRKSAIDEWLRNGRRLT